MNNNDMPPPLDEDMRFSVWMNKPVMTQAKKIGRIGHPMPVKRSAILSANFDDLHPQDGPHGFLALERVRWCDVKKDGIYVLSEREHDDDGPFYLPCAPGLSRRAMRGKSLRQLVRHRTSAINKADYWPIHVILLSDEVRQIVLESASEN